jgi:hypothetical protein
MGMAAALPTNLTQASQAAQPATDPEANKTTQAATCKVACLPACLPAWLQLDHQRLHGIHRLWLDHVISQVTGQFGTGSAVFAALHACMSAGRACVSAAALESRAAELAAQAASEALLRQQQPLWEDKSER